MGWVLGLGVWADLSILGMPTSCKAEPSSYNAATDEIAVTNINNTNDCVNKLVTRFGLKPSQLKIVYDAAGNQIKISLSGQTITAKPCAAKESSKHTSWFSWMIPKVFQE